MGYFAVHSLCPNGFLKHDNSCYKMIRTLATWAEATVSMNSLDIIKLIYFCLITCLHDIASVKLDFFLIQIKTYISSLMHTIRFLNNLRQVRSGQNIGKSHNQIKL
jgi:hypothetical protein